MFGPQQLLTASVWRMKPLRMALVALTSVSFGLSQISGRPELKQEAGQMAEARRKLVQEIADSPFNFFELGYQDLNRRNTSLAYWKRKAFA
jgi:hypothetical protein